APSRAAASGPTILVLGGGARNAAGQRAGRRTAALLGFFGSPSSRVSYPVSIRPRSFSPSPSRQGHSASSDLPRQGTLSAPKDSNHSAATRQGPASSLIIWQRTFLMLCRTSAP